MHIIGFRWYIRGWVVWKQVVCLLLTMFMLKLYLKAIRSLSLNEIERG